MVYLRYLIMANKPRIRFRGFTEDWEQRKLDDIVKIKTGGGTPKTTNPEYWSGDIPWIQSSDLVEGDIVHVNINKYINDRALKNSAAKLISRDSIALVTRVGVGKVAVINQDFTTSQDFLSLSNFDGNDIKFFAYQLYRLMQENAKILQGTSIKGITKTDLIEQSIVIPSSIQEQNLIANVLSKIDSIITLHQHKLKKLNLAKKALLQKLFPRNGSQFPVVRFKGFTDAWEQRKLSDITEVIMGQSPSSKNYTDNPNDNILVQGNADLKDGKVIPRLWTKEITKTIDKDGIILTVRAPVGDVAKTDYKVVLGRGVAGIKGNDYIYHFLQKLQNNQYWVSLSSGSTFESINSNDIKDLIIDIPSIEEQTKISILLNNVNSIITLHQRKLEKLQEVKKGLLQKMFV